MDRLNRLKDLIKNGQFHHATYRDIGTVWEGLWVYRKNDDMKRGFSPELVFQKDDPLLVEAENLTRKTGISVGSYGQG